METFTEQMENQILKSVRKSNDIVVEQRKVLTNCNVNEKQFQVFKNFAKVVSSYLQSFLELNKI